MLWLALHLPDLALEAHAATLLAEQALQPLALVAEHRITAVNTAAAAAGVQPGQRRATALALCPALQLGVAQAERDAAALLAVAHAALAFTPMVCCESGDTVLLEVQASLRCFGGLSRLRQRLRQALVPLGHRVCVAEAPTPLAAVWLARWCGVEADSPTWPTSLTSPTSPAAAPPPQPAQTLTALRQRLAPAPLALLAGGEPQAQALAAMGLHQLGALLALPREGLARRFGEALLDELDRALGQRPDQRQPLALPAVFDNRLELQTRADTSEQVLHAAGLLLARLVAWAGAQQAQVGAFTLRMQHEGRHRERLLRQRGAAAQPRGAAAGDLADAVVGEDATELHIHLAEASLNPEHLQLLLRERLQRLPLAAPTLELRLLCSDLAHRPPPNGELFPNRQSHALGLVRLLERLRARLGEAQVLRPAPVADHRPEKACLLAPVQPGRVLATAVRPARPVSSGSGPVADAPALPLHHPLWLLPEPQPLAQRGSQPWWQGRALRLLSGPERIETGWWDGEPALRDYYIAQGAGGTLVWVFCRRLQEDRAGEPLWFLQGLFA